MNMSVSMNAVRRPALAVSLLRGRIAPLLLLAARFPSSAALRHPDHRRQRRSFASRPAGPAAPKVPPLPRNADDLRRVAVETLVSEDAGDAGKGGAEAQRFYHTPEQIREARERRRRMATHWRLEYPMLALLGFAGVISGASVVNYVYKPNLTIPIELEQEYEEKFYPVPEEVALEPGALSARDQIIANVQRRYGDDTQQS